MLLCLVGLTLMSIIVLIVGAVWTLVIGGQARTQSGPEVGAEIMAGQMTEDEGGHVVAQRKFFKGQGVKVESEVEISLAEIKQLIRAGHWSHAFPVLMAVGGLMGLLLCGSVTLLLSLGGLIGLPAVVAALYGVIRILVDFARA